MCTCLRSANVCNPLCVIYPCLSMWIHVSSMKVSNSTIACFNLNLCRMFDLWMMLMLLMLLLSNLLPASPPPSLPSVNYVLTFPEDKDNQAASLGQLLWEWTGQYLSLSSVYVCVWIYQEQKEPETLIRYLRWPQHRQYYIYIFIFWWNTLIQQNMLIKCGKWGNQACSDVMKWVLNWWLLQNSHSCWSCLSCHRHYSFYSS